MSDDSDDENGSVYKEASTSISALSAYISKASRVLPKGNSYLYLSALNVEVYLHESTDMGLSVSSSQVSVMVTNNLSCFRTNYTWIELQYLLSRYQACNNVYGPVVPPVLLDCDTLHKMRLSIIFFIYNEHLSAQGRLYLLEYVKEHVGEWCYNCLKTNKDLSYLVHVGFKEFRDEELANKYTTLSHEQKLIIGEFVMFRNKDECYKALMAAAASVGEFHSDHEIINKINSDQPLPAHVYLNLIPPDVLDNIALPYKTTSMSTLIEHVQRNMTYTAGPKYNGLDLGARSKIKREVVTILKKHFTDLNLVSDNAWIILGDICVIKYVNKLLSLNEFRDATIEAQTRIHNNSSSEAVDYFTLQDTLDKSLGGLTPIIKSLGCDMSEFEAKKLDVLNSAPGQQLFESVCRLKGTVYEMLSCHHQGLIYRPEYLKPNLLKIIKNAWPEEALTQISLANNYGTAMTLTPDAYEVYQPGTREHRRATRQITEFARTHAKIFTVITVTEEEQSDDSGSNHSDERPDSGKKDVIKNVDLEDKPIIAIYEMAWAFNVSDKSKNDEKKWLSIICELLLLSWPIVLIIDVRNSSDSMWYKCSSYSSIRTLITDMLMLVNGNMDTLSSLQMIVEMRDWHHVKSLSQIPNNAPPNLKNQIEKSKKDLLHMLGEGESYMHEDTIEKLETVLESDKWKIWDAQLTVQKGIEFLAAVLDHKKLDVSQTIIDNGSLIEFENGFYKEMKKVNSGTSPVKNFFTTEILFQGRLEDEFLYSQKASNKRSALDLLMNCSMPQTQGIQKKQRRLLNALQMHVCELSGVEVVSKSDRTLCRTGLNRSDHSSSVARSIVGVGAELNEVAFYKAFEPSSMLIKEEILKNLRQIVADINNGNNVFHNCKRSALVLETLKDPDIGIIKPRADVLKRKLENRIYPKLLVEGVKPKEGHIPTFEQAKEQLDLFFDSLTVVEDNILLESLISDVDIMNHLIASGFSKAEYDIHSTAVKLLCSITYFRRLVVLSEIAECFETLYKRKKAGLVVETRLRSTKGRVYLVKQRNYDEAITCMYMRDDGTNSFKFKMTHKQASLYNTLPSSIVSIFVMNFQGLLCGNTKIIKAVKALLPDMVESIKKTAVLHLEDSYVEPGSSLPEALDESDSKDSYLRICSGIVGILLTVQFRLHVNQDNNTAASMSRYAIMYNWSKIADSEGLGKKLVNKCVYIWDYIEQALIRYMFKFKFLDVNACESPPCYHIGFMEPIDTNQAVSCMYYHHIYVKSLGKRSAATNKSHESYLEGELLMRKKFDLEEDMDHSIGYDRMYDLFDEWLEKEGDCEEVLDEASGIFSVVLGEESKIPAMSSFVLELSAANLRNTLGNVPFNKLVCNKSVGKTLTSVAEPTSVISSMAKVGKASAVAKAIIGDMDRSVQNMKTDYSINKTREIFQADDSVKELIKNNTAFSKLLDQINRSIRESACELLPKLLDDFCENRLSVVDIVRSEGRDIIKGIKQVNKIAVKRLRVLRSKGDVELSAMRDFKCEEHEDQPMFEHNSDIDALNDLLQFDVDKVKVAELEELCEKALSIFDLYVQKTREEGNLDRVDLKVELRDIEEEIANYKREQIVIYYMLIAKVSMTKLYTYEWAKRINAHSVPPRDFNLSEIGAATFLIGCCPFASEYIIRVSSSKKSLSKVIANRENVRAATTLEEVLTQIEDITALTSSERAITSFIHRNVGNLQKKVSQILNNFGNQSASYRSTRSTSLELMAGIISTYNETQLFQVASRILSSGFEYLYGSAPKAQMMGIRELAILEICTKLVMAVYEAISSSILQYMESDLLENPKRKLHTLIRAGRNIRECLDGGCRFLSTSGDRSKWGPKHSYLEFFIFNRTFYKDTPFSDMMLLICLAGCQKKLEIPVSSLESVVRTLINLTEFKSENSEAIVAKITLLFEKLDRVPLEYYNNYVSMEPHDLMYYVEAVSDEDDPDLPSAQDILLTMDRPFDWAKELDTDDLTFMSKFLMVGFTSTQLHVMHMLSKSRLYTIMFTHMNQGIPHRGSSICHNAMLLLAERVFLESAKDKIDTQQLELEAITSSDDYYSSMKCPAEIISSSDFTRLFFDYTRIQICIAGACNIKDSSKSVTSSLVSEVYSSFETGVKTNLPLIKLLAQFHLPGSQSTPLQHNLEENTKINQIVDFSGTACDLFTYQVMKHTKIKHMTGIKDDILSILRECCGSINPLHVISYDCAIRQDTDNILLNRSWSNYQWVLEHMNRAGGSLKKLGVSMRSDMSKTKLGKIEALTSFLLDGLLLSVNAGNRNKVNTGFKYKEGSKLVDSFSLPYSQKLKNKRIKLRSAVPESANSGPGMMMRMAARGGSSTIIPIEESRLAQALTSTKLEIKLSGMFEESGYAMLSYFLNSHCVKLEGEKFVSKYLQSWSDRINNSDDPMSLAAAKTKFKLSDIIAVLMTVSSAIVLSSNKDLENENISGQELSSRISDLIGNKSTPKDEETVTKTADPIVVTEPKPETGAIPKTPAAASSSSSEPKEVVVIPKDLGKKKKKKDRRKKKKVTPAVGEESKKIDWYDMKIMCGDEVLPYESAQLTEEVPEIIQEKEERGGAFRLLNESLRYDDIKGILNTCLDSLSHYMDTVNKSEMMFIQDNRCLRVNSKRPVRVGEVVILGVDHYSRVNRSALINNWALVACNVLYADEVSELNLNYSHYPSLKNDVSLMITKLGSKPKKESEYNEYFTRAEAAFGSSIPPRRLSWIRAHTREETIYGSELVDKLNLNVVDGWLVDQSISREHLQPVVGEASQICQTVASMASGVKLTGKRIDTLINSISQFIDKMPVVDSSTIRSLLVVYEGQEIRAPNDLTNLVSICSGGQLRNTKAETIGSIQLCSSVILSQKTIVVTDGRLSLSYIESENLLIINQRNVSSFTTLMPVLLDHLCGFTYPSTDLEKSYVINKMEASERGKRLVNLQPIFVTMGSQYSFQRTSEFADFIAYLDNTVPLSVKEREVLTSYTKRVASDSKSIHFEHVFENVTLTPMSNNIRLALLKDMLEASCIPKEKIEELANERTSRELSFKTCKVKTRPVCRLMDMIKILNSCQFEWPKYDEGNTVNSLMTYYATRFKGAKERSSNLAELHISLENFSRSLDTNSSVVSVPQTLCSWMSSMVCSTVRLKKEDGSPFRFTFTTLQSHVVLRAKEEIKLLIRENSSLIKYLLVLSLGLSSDKRIDQITMELCLYNDIVKISDVQISDVSLANELSPLFNNDDIFVYRDQNSSYYLTVEDTWFLNSYNLMDCIVKYVKQSGPMTSPSELKLSNTIVHTSNLSIKGTDIVMSNTAYHHVMSCIGSVEGKLTKHNTYIVSSEIIMKQILNNIFMTCLYEIDSLKKKENKNNNWPHMKSVMKRDDIFKIINISDVLIGDQVHIMLPKMLKDLFRKDRESAFEASELTQLRQMREKLRRDGSLIDVPDESLSNRDIRKKQKLIEAQKQMETLVSAEMEFYREQEERVSAFDDLA